MWCLCEKQLVNVTVKVVNQIYEYKNPELGERDKAMVVLHFSCARG